MKNINKWLAGSLGSLVLLGAQSQASSENVSVSVGLDVNSHFISYGASVWNDDDETGDDLTFNPSFVVDFALSDTSGIYAGVWMDVNEMGDPGTGSGIQEVDTFVGYYFAAGDFSFDVNLQEWAWGSEVESIFDVNISYDAKFSPTLTIHNRYATQNPDQDKGTMLVLGGSFYSGDVFSVSANIGGSVDDYHQEGEDGYAFSSVTLGFGIPIAVGEGYGDWDFHGGVTLYHTSTKTVDNPDNTFLTFNLGMGMSF